MREKIYKTRAQQPIAQGVTATKSLAKAGKVTLPCGTAKGYGTAYRLAESQG